MTWVPPYATSNCLDRLNESFDGVGMKNGLTHLGLQFWRPSEKGKMQLVDDFKPIDDSTIIQFRKWGEAHNVRVLLCVYNGYKDGWNWELAKTAFDTHRKQFIAALVSETVRLQLDGVDIDFEGKELETVIRRLFSNLLKNFLLLLKPRERS